MKLIVNSEILKMSDQEYEQAKAEVKARAKKYMMQPVLLQRMGKQLISIGLKTLEILQKIGKNVRLNSELKIMGETTWSGLI
jgi:hypothetical protein